MKKDICHSIRNYEYNNKHFYHNVMMAEGTREVFLSSLYSVDSLSWHIWKKKIIIFTNRQDKFFFHLNHNEYIWNIQLLMIKFPIPLTPYFFPTLTPTWALSHGNSVKVTTVPFLWNSLYFFSNTENTRHWHLVVLAFTVWFSSFPLSLLGFGNLCM